MLEGIAHQKTDSSELKEVQRQNRVFAMSSLSGQSMQYSKHNYQEGASSHLLFDVVSATKAKRIGEKQGYYTFGDCDNTPYVLLQMYRQSFIHKSLIDSISNMMFGGGLEYSVPKFLCRKNEIGFLEEVEVELTETQKEKHLRDFKLWAKSLKIENFYKYACFQYKLYGGYYSQRVYDTNPFNARTYLRYLYSPKYCDVRQGIERTDDRLQSLIHYVSKDFATTQSNLVSRYEKQEILVDDGLIYDEQGRGVRQVFVGNVTDYRDIYATPDYESLDFYDAILGGSMLVDFDLNSLKRGFSLDHIILIYRDKAKTQEEEQAQQQKDLDRVKGSIGSTGSKTAVWWVTPTQNLQTGEVKAPDVIKVVEIPHQNNQDRYDGVKKSFKEVLMTGHGASSPETFGLNGERSSGFANQSEFLLTSIKQMYWSRINPMRRSIIQDIQDIVTMAGWQINVMPKDNIPSFKDLSDTLIMSTRTTNEIRKDTGKHELSEDELMALYNDVRYRQGTDSNLINQTENG